MMYYSFLIMCAFFSSTQCFALTQGDELFLRLYDTAMAPQKITKEARNDVAEKHRDFILLLSLPKQKIQTLPALKQRVYKEFPQHEHFFKITGVLKVLEQRRLSLQQIATEIEINLCKYFNYVIREHSFEEARDEVLEVARDLPGIVESIIGGNVQLPSRL